jgi:hypothetical protein
MMMSHPAFRPMTVGLPSLRVKVLSASMPFKNVTVAMVFSGSFPLPPSALGQR